MWNMQNLLLSTLITMTGQQTMLLHSSSTHKLVFSTSIFIRDHQRHWSKLNPRTNLMLCSPKESFWNNGKNIQQPILVQEIYFWIYVGLCSLHMWCWISSKKVKQCIWLAIVLMSSNADTGYLIPQSISQS